VSGSAATTPRPHRSGRPRSGAPLTRYAYLSIAAAVATIAIKTVAYLITGSVGLLSDALESVVNLVAAAVALWALRLAARPPDRTHHYGHGKAEYFSAGAEGLMIVVAAGVVVWSAVARFIHPQPLNRVGAGLLVSAAAATINLAVAIVLLRAGRRHRSITLSADGRHLLTDVWTSVGVLVGVGLVALTGWERLDPAVAVLVGVNILATGFSLVRRSSAGLMDASLPAADQAAVDAVLARHRSDTVTFHAVRTRAAGRYRFVSLHLLVPGDWTVQQGHDLAEQIEAEIAEALPDASVTTHIEPIDDPASFDDVLLDSRQP
jgi:cation diffusion facilitator family transporter